MEGVDPGQIFEALNAEQRSAVEAVRGPLCILAGAGSGKTTTITRRIANQVHSAVFEPGQILAVTFTDKAAGEMRARLEHLGVEGVRARTFHSAALAQLRNLAPEPPGQILPSKVMPLRQLANSLPRPYKFRPAADLATEIEWAKNRRVRPDDYLASLKDREPPIPADLMAGIYKRYESGKRDRGLIDFEDLLELTIQMFQQDEFARERFAERYHAFTVDEYQDVNELQETLLRAWLGARDDLCVVGDDYQSIYGFTGATPAHLLRMPQRFPNTKVVRLELNYRSTPEVLGVANRLVPDLGGAEKVLRAVRPSGPEPQLRFFSSSGGEPKFVVDRVRALIAEDVPLEEIAILYRVNFRSEDYEEVLAGAGIPYQVRDGAFLSRRTARQMLSALKRSKATSVADEVEKNAERAGYVPSPSDDLGDQELTRQNDLARFIHLASEFDDGVRTCAEFVADVESRFGTEGEGRGVQLLTLHRAKGLEFDAVILPAPRRGRTAVPPFQIGRRYRRGEATVLRGHHEGQDAPVDLVGERWQAAGQSVRRRASPSRLRGRQGRRPGEARARRGTDRGRRGSRAGAVRRLLGHGRRDRARWSHSGALRRGRGPRPLRRPRHGRRCAAPTRPPDQRAGSGNLGRPEEVAP